MSCNNSTLYTRTKLESKDIQSQKKILRYNISGTVM